MKTKIKIKSPCDRTTDDSTLRLNDLNLQRLCESLDRIANAVETQDATLQKILIEMPPSPYTSGLESALEDIQSPLEGIQKGIEAISNAMLSKHDFNGIESALKGIQTEIGSSTYSK